MPPSPFQLGPCFCVCRATRSATQVAASKSPTASRSASRTPTLFSFREPHGVQDAHAHAHAHQDGHVLAHAHAHQDGHAQPQQGERLRCGRRRRRIEKRCLVHERDTHGSCNLNSSVCRVQTRPPTHTRTPTHKGKAPLPTPRRRTRRLVRTRRRTPRRTSCKRTVDALACSGLPSCLRRLHVTTCIVLHAPPPICCTSTPLAFGVTRRQPACERGGARLRLPPAATP